MTRDMNPIYSFTHISYFIPTYCIHVQVLITNENLMDRLLCDITIFLFRSYLNYRPHNR